MRPELPRVDAYLAHYARVMPDETVWMDGERALTFAQAGAAVDRIAAELLSGGVVAGARIAVYGKPSIEFMALFLAITSIGAIYVGLNPKYTVRELAAVIDDCEPVILFQLLGHEHEHACKIDELLACRSIRKIDFAIGSAFDRDGHASERDLAAARERIDPADVALLVYTSGSTGAPKGAQLTHRGLTFIGAVANDPAHFGVDGARSICNLPINHVGCVVDICSNSLIGGGTLLFQADFNPAMVLQAIEKYRLTLVGGVPAMFLAMVQVPAFATTNYASLQRVVLAGNSPSLQLVELLQNVMKCPILNGYGLTEGMGFSTFTDLDDPAEVIAHTVGRFDPRIEWRIHDDEIQLRGEWLFAGYYNRPAETAEAFTHDGWFRTGDLARQTPEGRIVLSGRRKEVFKSGGYNVYPREIEQVLESLPGVVMAVVVPRSDPTYDEVGHAYVIADSRLGAEVIRQNLRDRLANYKVPKYVELVDDLPLLPVGKVDRVALKRRANAIDAGSREAEA